METLVEISEIVDKLILVIRGFESITAIRNTSQDVGADLYKVLAFLESFSPDSRPRVLCPACVNHAGIAKGCPVCKGTGFIENLTYEKE